MTLDYANFTAVRLFFSSPLSSLLASLSYMVFGDYSFHVLLFPGGRKGDYRQGFAFVRHTGVLPSWSLLRHNLIYPSIFLSTFTLLSLAAEMKAISSVACDCGSGPGSSACFDSSSSQVQVAIAKACPYLESNITALHSFPSLSLTLWVCHGVCCSDLFSFFSLTWRPCVFLSWPSLRASSARTFWSTSALPRASCARLLPSSPPRSIRCFAFLFSLPSLICFCWFQIFLSRVENPYAIVMNDRGAAVGQITSNGVSGTSLNQLIFDDSEFNIFMA